MDRDDHDELLRCRERLHTLETHVLALELHQQSLREWRAEARRQLEGLVNANDVAEAVAQRMKQDRTIGLTLVQKLAAFVVGAVLLADSVKGLLS